MTDFLPTEADPEGEFTELADAQIGRIDLVGKGANGLPFLIAKGQGGLMSPEIVRGLIGERDQRAEPEVVQNITVTGSPAAISKMIHEAAVRDRERTTRQLREVEQTGQRAAQALDTLRVAAEGARDTATPQEHAMTAPADTVAKADDLDTTELLEGAGDSMPMPGSPEWEAIDAATACKWIAVLGRAKNAICLLAEREMQEAVVGDDADAENAFQLDDASCAIDCAINLLAPYAVGEQMEAEGDDTLQAVGKALAGAADPIDVIEGFAPVVKAGRVLSGANETKLRDAVSLLQGVLASLPAPVESDQPVAKEATMPATETTEIVEAPEVAPVADDVTKAKGDPVVVVFNADGKPIGVVDPKDLVAISDASAGSAKDAEPTTADDTETGGGAAAPADDAGAADAAAAAPAEDASAAAAPPDAAAAAPADDDTIQKSDGAAALSALLKEALAPLAEQFANQGELASIVKGLQERVEEIAKMPDDRKSPVLNGVLTPFPGADDDLADLRKAVDDAQTPSEKRDAQAALAYARIKGRFAR